MKTAGIFLLLSLTIITLVQESVYTHSVSMIEGGSQSLSAYQGKKILVVTLPVQQSASADSMLFSLDTLSAARTGNLVVIGAPSFEDGFTVAQKEQLKQWYRSKLGNQVVISDGLYTRRTSGSSQHPLFAWLTKLEKNENFNIDVEGQGYKFFINQNGQLIGVLRPHTKISSMAVQRTLQL